MNPSTVPLREVSNEKQLEDVLSKPYPEDVDCARTLDGDVLILGAGGKMGPTLVQRIVRSTTAAASSATVYAASHEILRRQGLLRGLWCLDSRLALSAGQMEEIDRVHRAYPHLNDDGFVAKHLDAWLA